MAEVILTGVSKSFGADVALGAQAGEVNLPVPLAMPGAKRAARIKQARARAGGNAVQRMGVMRAGAGDDALFMSHGRVIWRGARLGNGARAAARHARGKRV